MANRFHVKQCATLSAHPKGPKANTQQLRNVVCELALYCPVGSKCGWALGHSLVEHIGAAVGHCDVRQCGPQYAMGHLRTCHCTALRAQEEDELAFLQGNLALEEQVLNRRPSTCSPASHARPQLRSTHSQAIASCAAHRPPLGNVVTACGLRHSAARHALLQVRKRTQETLEMEIDAGVETNFSFRLDVAEQAMSLKRIALASQYGAEQRHDHLHAQRIKQ